MKILDAYATFYERKGFRLRDRDSFVASLTRRAGRIIKTIVVPDEGATDSAEVAAAAAEDRDRA